jgi:hypothetical protein
MTTVTEGTVLRVVASFLWSDGNVNQNVFACVPTGGSPPYDGSDIADDMEDWLDDMYLDLTAGVSDEIAGNSVTIYEWDPVDEDWDEVFSQSWGWSPSNVGEQLPRGVAGLVNMWTTDPDVQGKKYLPGWTEGNITDGLFNAGVLVDMLTFALAWYLPFVGAASGATFTPGVWSVVGLVFKAAVDHYATSAIPAYQRRRKRNVGI